MLEAGIDEVGRGCLAGPVVSACVLIKATALRHIPVADSKKLSAKRREHLAQQISQSCVAWGIGIASEAEIDRINIRQATHLAMQRACHACWVQPDKIWVDGHEIPKLPKPAEAIIGGDAVCPYIAGASILAKVYRDHLMQVFAAQYPGYGFATHKGYGTQQHLAALQQHGVCPIHRLSFKPVASYVDILAES